MTHPCLGYIITAMASRTSLLTHALVATETSTLSSLHNRMYGTLQTASLFLKLGEFWCVCVCV